MHIKKDSMIIKWHGQPKFIRVTVIPASILAELEKMKFFTLAKLYPQIVDSLYNLDLTHIILICFVTWMSAALHVSNSSRGKGTLHGCHNYVKGTRTSEAYLMHREQINWLQAISCDWKIEDLNLPCTALSTPTSHFWIMSCIKINWTIRLWP